MIYIDILDHVWYIYIIKRGTAQEETKMKYNKSEIMKAAWNLFNQSKKWTMTLSFSVCLHRAWDAAKAAIANAKKLANSYTWTINGVELTVNAAMALSGIRGWVVSGNTYAVRKEIKRAGFSWDAANKYWYTTDRTVAERFC